MSERSGGVQAVTRSFAVLELLADHDGAATLSQLATASDLPAPTIHRLLRTLTAQGYVRQQPDRRYAIGPRLIRLGEAASRLVGTWARPYLASLVDQLGETANLAMLDGDQVVYLAQAPSRHAMRMFTEVGRRLLPHSTGVGKALLATLPTTDVRALLHRTGTPARTTKTLTDLDALCAQLEEVRRHGYALDDEEQEIGVRCVAVAVPSHLAQDVDATDLEGLAPTALSISGPTARVTDDLVRQAVPALRAAADGFAGDLRRTQ